MSSRTSKKSIKKQHSKDVGCDTSDVVYKVIFIEIYIHYNTFTHYQLWSIYAAERRLMQFYFPNQYQILRHGSPDSEINSFETYWF